MSGAPRLLLADDEPTFLSATADWLRLQGFACDCAADAHEAARMLTEGRYHLVISDIRIPGNTALEFVRSVRELAPGVPVILVTGYPSAETAIQSIDMPVMAYLVKPLDYEKLLAKVREGVARSDAYYTMHDMRQNLDQWCQSMRGMDEITVSSRGEASLESVDAYLAMNLKNIAFSLDHFRQLIGGLTQRLPRQAGWEAVATAQLDTAYAAILKTIHVLEQTKELFKSKQLARLRRELQAIVDAWPRPVESPHASAPPAPHSPPASNIPLPHRRLED